MKTLMMSRPCRAAAVACASGVLIAAAGCSGSSSEGELSSENAPKVEQDAALAAMVPKSIRDKGYLEVASEIYPPAVIVSGEGEEPTGWEVETVRAVASTLGLEARIKIVPWEGIIPGLEGDRYQVAAGEIFMTPERTKAVTFVQNHVSTDSLLVESDSDVTADTEDAMCGLAVSVQLGSAEADLAEEIAGNCESAGDDDLEIKTFKEQAQVNLAVSEGRVDAAIGSTSQVAYVVDEAGGQFKTVELAWGPENPTGIALARNENTDELAKAIAAAVDKLIVDGTLQEIVDIHNGGLGAIEKAEIVPAPAS